MVNSPMLRELLFWGSWLLIPLLWECGIGFVSALALLLKFIVRGSRSKEQMDYQPLVSILVPIYNSEKTLEACLDSIAGQTYATDKLEILLLNNGDRNTGYRLFQKFQVENPTVRIRWYDTHSGKSRALNQGILSCNGKYIINIDSDGWLDQNAVARIVSKFERNNKVVAMTGVILIDPELIKKTKNMFLYQIQCCEQFEYLESFLVGRNFNSLFNSMYTLAGACSAFRRDILMKTNLYNFETVGEDTHMTFQIRDNTKGKIILCTDAYFYVDPIEGLNKLYAQRQRWQRGQLEVAKLFIDMHLGSAYEILTKFSLRILIADHTLAFPRLIWIFGMIYMYFNDYPLRLLLGANILLYLLYVINSGIFMGVAILYLKDQREMKKFALKNGGTIFWMPVFRFIVYWMRIAGIINSVTMETHWNRRTFSDEMRIVRSEIDLFRQRWIKPVIQKLDRRLNDE